MAILKENKEKVLHELEKKIDQKYDSFINSKNKEKYVNRKENIFEKNSKNTQDYEIKNNEQTDNVFKIVEEKKDLQENDYKRLKQETTSNAQIKDIEPELIKQVFKFESEKQKKETTDYLREEKTQSAEKLHLNNKYKDTEKENYQKRWYDNS